MDSNTMTKEELRAKAEGLVKEYNDLFQSGNLGDAVKLQADIDSVIGEYTALARKECFDACKAAEDPMKEACIRETFTTIRVKDTKEGDEKIPVRSIEDAVKPIDLLRLHKDTAGGIGHDEHWMHYAQKFNCLTVVYTAKELGITKPGTDPKKGIPIEPKDIYDSYEMSDIAYSIKMGDGVSKTALLKALNMTVQAMIGPEYKARSQDVAWILMGVRKLDKTGMGVRCAKHATMRNLCMRICGRILTDGDPYLVYGLKKDK